MPTASELSAENKAAVEQSMAGLLEAFHHAMGYDATAALLGSLILYLETLEAEGKTVQ